MTDNLFNRRGTIVVSRTLAWEEPEILRFVFKRIGFIPFNIKYEAYKTLEYEGFSDEFEIIPDVQKSPLYKILLTSSENSKNPGKIETVKVRRDDN